MLKEESTNPCTYLNIKNGKIVVKIDGVLTNFASVTGTIKSVRFEDGEYNGDKYELAKIFIDNGKGSDYCLQMKVDSGYFRGLCNSLRSSATPTAQVEITPTVRNNDKGKPQTTCFVSQSGKNLKYAFTVKDMGELPLLKVMDVKGKKVYDNTEQLNYWKEWLKKTYK